MPFQKTINGRKSKFWYVDRWIGGKPNGIHINKSTRSQDYDEACAIEEEWVAEAEERLVERMEGINNPDSITLSQALEIVNKAKWAHNRSSDRPVNHITECIRLLGGDLPLSELAGDRGSQRIQRLQQTLLHSDCNKPGHTRVRGTTTVNRYMASLRTLLYYMRDDYSIRSLQVPKIPMFSKKGGTAERERDRVLQPTEEIELFKKMDAKYPEFTSFFKFLLDTGMRLSEALQIDFTKHVFLDRRMVYLNATSMTLKTNQSRTVPLTRRAVEILKKRKAVSFPKPFPWTATKCDQVFKVCKIDMGLGKADDFVPHMLRHTCITRMLLKGVPFSIVMSWAGHMSAQTTKRYTHIAGDDLMVGAEALDALNAENKRPKRQDTVKHPD
jgi:integrase